eukprot:gene22616-34611_t
MAGAAEETADHSASEAEHQSPASSRSGSETRAPDDGDQLANHDDLEGALPCPATEEAVRQFLNGRDSYDYDGDVYFVAPWLVMGKVLLEDDLYATITVRIAGIQGPLVAIGHDRTKDLLKKLNDSAVKNVKLEHQSYPFYLLGDVVFGDGESLGETLVAKGLARVAHSCVNFPRLRELELEYLSKPNERASLDLRKREPAITIRGKTADVLSGNFIEVDVLEVEKPTEGPLKAWDRDRKKRSDTCDRLCVALENITAGCEIDGDACAVEAQDLLISLIDEKEIRCEIHSAWKSISSVDERIVYHHDREHVRGAIFVTMTPSELEEALAAVYNAHPASFDIVRERYLSKPSDQLPDTLEISVSFVLSAMVLPLSFVPWVEVTPPEDFMCPITSDYLDCVEVQRDPRLQVPPHIRYERRCIEDRVA